MDRRIIGTASAEVDDERRRCRPGGPATGCRASARYVGRRKSMDTLVVTPAWVRVPNLRRISPKLQQVSRLIVERTLISFIIITSIRVPDCSIFKAFLCSLGAESHNVRDWPHLSNSSIQFTSAGDRNKMLMTSQEQTLVISCLKWGHF